MAEELQKRITVEEFFEWQQGQDRNYELVDGIPVMTVKGMTGATVRHDRITVNAIGTLFQKLRGKPCQPRTSDQSIVTFREPGGQISRWNAESRMANPWRPTSRVW